MAIDITPTSKRNATSDNAYIDLDVQFKRHPNTGDVVVRKDADAVKRAVRNIILTNHYERPFKPGFGGSIRNLLFELTSARKIRKASNRLKSTIELFEPRVKDVTVTLNEIDANEISLQVYFSIRNGLRNQSIDMTLTRAR